MAANSCLPTLIPFGYLPVSNWLCTRRPVLVVVAAIRLTVTSWLTNGLPRQFLVIKENRRCSILFHLLVPGGKWQTEISSLVSSASFCNSSFHNRTRDPLLPPLSAVIKSRRASGYASRPIMLHHRRMLSTANADVSWSVPTLTQPAFCPRS